MKALTRTIQGLTTYASDAQTVPVKLPLSGNLHKLTVECRMTNGATNARNLSMDDVVQLIEVVGNGSDVLVSLTPQEIARWHYLKCGKYITEQRTEAPGAIQRAEYPLYFGRWWNDSEYFLPAANFSDLELRVKYAPTIAATAFATGTFSLLVTGFFSMDGAPGAYRGTLTHKTVKSFTSVASGDDETLLPRGNPISGVMVYAYEAGTDPFDNITNVKLGLNNDETIIVNEPFKSMQDRNASEYWLNDVYTYQAHYKDTDTVNTKNSPIRSAQVVGSAAFLAANVQLPLRTFSAIAGDALTGIGAIVFEPSNAGATINDAVVRLAQVSFESIGIPNAVFVDTSPFGIDTALKSRDYDQVKLVLTQGNAGATVRTSIEEVRAF